MAFKVDDKHRLVEGTRLVRRILSPGAHTAGSFAETPSTTVLHFTFGSSAASSADWFRSSANTAKSSAHVVVGRDGEVIQCVDFNTAAHHAGKSTWHGRSGLNTWSFGIELANWGYLQNQGGVWTSWAGKIVHNPVMATHKNGNPNGTLGDIGWEPYPSTQIETAAEIVSTLIDRYGDQELIGHDDVSVGRKWDPGPAFDFANFRELASGGLGSTDPNRLIVRTPDDTLNLRQGPGIQFDIMEELPDGTILEPIEFQENWVLVDVLNNAGNARKSGWVHSHHTRAA